MLELQNALFENTLEVVGVEEVQQQFAGAVPVASNQNGDVKLNFGKYKGMSFQQVADSVDENGKSGREYLEWLWQKTDNNFIKGKLAGFLGK